MNAIGALSDLLSGFLIISGIVFLIIGAVGTYRFPDFWSRLHAVSVTDSAGMILLTLGMIVEAGFSLIAVKLIIIGLFLLFTGPTATHAVANAALVSGLLPLGSEPGAKEKAKRVSTVTRAAAKKRRKARS